MPQTREHIAILGVLGVERGSSRLSKRDLVDDEWGALARGRCRRVLRVTRRSAARRWSKSPRRRRPGLPISWRTIRGRVSVQPARRDIGASALAIDRGVHADRFRHRRERDACRRRVCRRRGDRDLPTAPRARIRGIQTTNAPRGATPGSRVALNLSGSRRTELERGHGRRSTRDARAVSIIRRECRPGCRSER